MDSIDEPIAYTIVSAPLHEDRRYAVLLQHADGYIHPVRKFIDKYSAMEYKERMLNKCLLGYEVNGVYYPSPLVLARMQECTVMTCFDTDR